MREFFPLNAPYQDLCGWMVAWISLNRQIPQDTLKIYHAHQNHFQTAFRNTIFHNLDPDTMLEVEGSMNKISVWEALYRLMAISTSGRLFTGVERTWGSGTLFMFGKFHNPQVVETIRDIRKILETITGRQLDEAIRGDIGLEDNDLHRYTPYESS